MALALSFFATLLAIGCWRSRVGSAHCVVRFMYAFEFNVTVRYERVHEGAEVRR